MKQNKCKDCKDRYLGCHDKCQSYLEWKKQRIEELHKKQEDAKYSATLEARTKTISKILKRH